MAHGNKNPTVIPAEKMALLAEKGFNNARLSREEKNALAEHGLAEYYAVKKSISTAVPPSDPQLIDDVMKKFFSATRGKGPSSVLTDIRIKLTSTVTKIIETASDWKPNSLVFAQRGNDSNSTSLFKEVGKYTVHIEIAKCGDKRSCITITLTDTSKREHFSFEAALYQNDQCIESVHVAKNRRASFSNVVTGDYSVKVAIKKGEITSVNIRLEE